MRLAVSNIAWSVEHNLEMLDLLAGKAVQGVEIAPTMIWPQWESATSLQVSGAAALLSERGFWVPALQSILYGKPQLQVFGDAAIQQQMLDHLDRVAAMAQTFGARALVFGSPKNRYRGSLSEQEAMDVAAQFFRRGAEIVSRRDCVIVLEANPSAYACNFITRWRQAVALVERVDHPGLRLHLDTACTHMAGDDIAEAISQCAGLIAHVHVSEPFLGNFTAPQVDHVRAAEALHGIGYSGWLTIEMKTGQNPFKEVAEAVDTVVRVYFG